MLIGALVLVAAGVVLYSHSGEVGAALVQLGERLQGRSHSVSQAASQVAQQAAPSSQKVGKPTLRRSKATSQVSPQADAQTAQEQVMTRAQSAAGAPAPAATDMPTTSEKSLGGCFRDGHPPRKSHQKEGAAKAPVDAKVAPAISRTSPRAVTSVPAEKASERKAGGKRASG